MFSLAKMSFLRLSQYFLTLLILTAQSFAVNLRADRTTVLAYDKKNEPMAALAEKIETMIADKLINIANQKNIKKIVIYSPVETRDAGTFFLFNVEFTLTNGIKIHNSFKVSPYTGSQHWLIDGMAERFGAARGYISKETPLYDDTAYSRYPLGHQSIGAGPSEFKHIMGPRVFQGINDLLNEDVLEAATLTPHAIEQMILHYRHILAIGRTTFSEEIAEVLNELDLELGNIGTAPEIPQKTFIPFAKSRAIKKQKKWLNEAFHKLNSFKKHLSSWENKLQFDVQSTIDSKMLKPADLETIQLFNRYGLDLIDMTSKELTSLEEYAKSKNAKIQIRFKDNHIFRPYGQGALARYEQEGEILITYKTENDSSKTESIPFEFGFVTKKPLAELRKNDLYPSLNKAVQEAIAIHLKLTLLSHKPGKAVIHEILEHLNLCSDELTVPSDPTSAPKKIRE